MRIAPIVFSMFLTLFGSLALGAQISITMDDPDVDELPLFSAQERNTRILSVFEDFKIKAALFVCGKRIDNPRGQALLKTWDQKGHLIGSHGYSHLNFNSTDFQTFSNDVLRVEPLLRPLKHFEKIFRFPFLKEGDTKIKRDQLRTFLRNHGYKSGYVTIDASDWAIDARLMKKLRKNPQAHLEPYRDFYLRHIWQRAQFYNDLAQKIYGREVRHTLLTHHSLLNALFLKDLLSMFKEKGWQLISAADAFSDPVFSDSPNIVPAGESLIWAKAKENGSYDKILRYPGENDSYENSEMDKLGL